MKKTEREELKKNPVNHFACFQCKTEGLTVDQFKEHLSTVHNLKAPFQGTKQMIMHINGAGYHSFTYEWIIEGFKFTQFTMRAKG